MGVDEARRYQRILATHIRISRDLAFDHLGDCLLIDSYKSRCDFAAARTVVDQQLAGKNHLNAKIVCQKQYQSPMMIFDAIEIEQKRIGIVGATIACDSVRYAHRGEFDRHPAATDSLCASDGPAGENRQGRIDR
jgi:hypothetical protein